MYQSLELESALVRWTMNGPLVHCGLFVGDPFYKLSFMCLTKLFFTRRTNKVNTKIWKVTECSSESWSRASVCAKIICWKKYTKLLYTKNAASTGETNYANIIYTSGYESQNSRDCVPVAPELGIFNLALRSSVSTRIWDPERKRLYFL